MKNFLILIAICWIGDCSTVEKVKTHKYRSEFHFSPAKNWMNDPNGMFYHDGLYHLYFQYNPFGEKWGHMSWGHATSTDLIHWEEQEIALYEEDDVMIFSGSAVVDRNNTSGFGDGTTAPVVAIYTGHIEGKNQSQHIAYSLDGGYTFTKYKGNPVLDLGMKDFRDPKVFWHKDTQKWVMVVALSNNHKLHFYGSENLIDWEFLSEFGPLGAENGLWECPDLFELPIDGDKENSRWVLQVDLGSNSNNPGSGGQYFIGDFDGTSFTVDTNVQEYPVWIDQGHDFYAAVSWFNWNESMPRQWLAWANNWNYAQDIPTEGWRSTMSLARNLELKTVGDKLFLHQEPVSSYKNLRSKHYTEDVFIDCNSELPLEAQKIIQTGRFEIELKLSNQDQGNIEVILDDQNGGFLKVKLDYAKGVITLSRNDSDSNFDGEIFTLPQVLEIEDGTAIDSIRLIYDKSLAEIFINDGLYTFTNQMFVDNSSLKLFLIAQGGSVSIDRLDIWSLDEAL